MARYDNSFLLFFIDIFVCICIFFLTLCIVFLGTRFFFFLRLFFFCCVQEPRKLYDVSRLKELQSWKRNFFSLFPFLYFFSSIAKPPAPPSNTIKMKKTSWVYTCPPQKKKKYCVSVKPRASSRSEESTTLSTCVAFFFLLFFKIIIKRKFPIFCYMFVDIGDVTNNFVIEMRRKKRKNIFVPSDSFRSATRRRFIVCPKSFERRKWVDILSLEK